MVEKTFDCESGDVCYIPETTPECYLTMRSALNIPDDQGLSADWHYVTIFQKPQRHVIAKPDNRVALFFGEEGLRECSEILRTECQIQIPEGFLVYAVEHWRATIEIIDACVASLKEPYADFREIDAWLHHTLELFIERYEQIKTSYPQEEQDFLAEWEKKNDVF